MVSALLRLKIVDGLCKEFFACAAGALDQDRAVAFRYIGKDTEDVTNQVVLADDVAEGVFLDSSFLSSSNRGRSLNVSTPPMICPRSLFNTAVLILMWDLLSAFP